MAHMATNARDKNRTNRNGVRAAYIPLGVDGRGASHVYDTRTETIHIVHDDGSRGRRLLGDHSVDDWMDAVESEYGWAHRKYGVGLVEMLAEQMGDA